MNAGQCSRKTCLQNKAFLAFSCYFFSDRNNLIEKRHKLVEIHVQLSPPFTEFSLLSLWQLIIADIQRIDLFQFYHFGTLLWKRSGFFFSIKLSLWMKYQRYFLTWVFRQTFAGESYVKYLLVR